MLAVLLAALGGCGGAATPTSTSSASGSPGGASSGGPTVSGTDVLTYHDDAARTGQDLTETVLTPANVAPGSFGRLRLLPADGAVDATPLVVSGLGVAGSTRNVVYIATEHDSVYAYDADSGALLAHVSLLGPGETPSDPRSCGQVSPEIGITATPVIDRSAGPDGTLFVVAMSKDATGDYYQRLHALDLVTLADRLPPRVIAATAAGNGPNSGAGQVQFDPAQYKERGALLLLGGQVYTVWASHCDIDPYNGWIIAYDESSLAQTQVLQLTPNGTRGAIWNAAGLAADAGAALYATIANGSFDTTLDSQGFPGQGDYGNAAVRLAAGPLQVTDYFTPFDTVAQSNNDEDLGSGSLLVVPDQTDAGGQIHQLLVLGGKDGVLYLLDRSRMGGFEPNANAVYQQIAVGGALFSAPAYFDGTLYVGDAGGTLKAYTFSDALLPGTPSSQTAVTFPYPGTSPAISADGTANAILWTVASAQGSPAVLYAFNPANLGQQYYSSATAAGGRDSFGNGNKFITPVIANGKVFVGTTDGVAEFGLL